MASWKCFTINCITVLYACHDFKNFSKLSRFAHLINIEYFDSLFSALNNLIESQVSSVLLIPPIVKTFEIFYGFNIQLFLLFFNSLSEIWATLLWVGRSFLGVYSWACYIDWDSQLGSAISLRVAIKFKSNVSGGDSQCVVMLCNGMQVL